MTSFIPLPMDPEKKRKIRDILFPEEEERRECVFTIRIQSEEDMKNWFEKHGLKIRALLRKEYS